VNVGSRDLSPIVATFHDLRGLAPLGVLDCVLFPVTAKEALVLPNRSMPTSTVIPVLAYADVAEAVDWLCETFGFSERWRAGNHRAQLGCGDGAVVVTAADIGTGFASDVSHSVMVRVEDADSHHEHARARGARILHPPTDHPYGERQYSVEDLAGHRWSFSQSIADVAPEEWGGATPG
jgi:uncharacterized glyoxalase superfamily protein PhnB